MRLRHPLAIIALSLLLPMASAVEVGSAIADQGLVIPVHAAAGLPVTAGESGERFDLSALRGKVVYLDVWASWCEPCRQSFPWMRDMHQRYAERGLVVLAVSIDQTRKGLTDFLDRVEAPFAIGHDAEQVIAATLAIPAMPTALLIDADGIVRRVHGGFEAGDGPELEAAILELLP